MMTEEEAKSEVFPAAMKPEEVGHEEAGRVLGFLNAARTAEEIARTVEIPGERDVGIGVAQNILKRRQELGAFENLQQVAAVPQVGPARFAQIVAVLGKESERAIEPERAQFRALLLKNPNYFGNVEPSPFPPVKPLANNTSYEELTCVGYNPQFSRIEAVVLIKRTSGYGGNVCSSGTPEYVRFYADWNNDGNWIDLGMVSFTAYDIPGEKPLEYDVTLTIDPREKLCFIENLPRVRAILSWNNPPPPNTPGHVPVWGNALEARIQIDVLKLIILDDLLKLAKAKVPAALLQSLDLAQPAALQAKALSLAELQETYKDKGVPGHRFSFAEAQKLMAQPMLAESLMAPGLKNPLEELGIADAAELIDQMLQVSGNTHYEELKCLGLNPNLDTLVGVLTVKRPYGYSGGLCAAGSQEYVAFWVDWVDGAGWTYAGTASVNVHDIPGIPPEGLQYAVFLPIDLSGRRRPCEQGAKVVRMRAILSWAAPPPPWNPNYAPSWGNRRETLIHIRPGPVVLPDVHTPFISSVGDIVVPEIDNLSGLATGSGVMTGLSASNSPFGGMITISGQIAFPPNVLGGGATALKYKVYVRRSGILGEPWQPLSTSFTAKVTLQTGAIFTGPFNQQQSIDGDGYYTYLEDLTGNERRSVEGRVLVRWVTGAPMTGLWEIRMDAFDPAANMPYAGTQVIKVRLDNAAPIPTHITITGFSQGGGPIQPAVECGKFLVGDVIHGTYTVGDEHFRLLTLAVEPTGPAGGVTVSPPSRAYPIVPTTGETGAWSLDTSGMLPCGYIVRLWTEDRTIVSSRGIGWENADSVGFCLEIAEE